MPLSCAAAIGKACTQNSQCGASASCLITDSTANRGVCTCACTPDDPSTPLQDEDSCPEPYHNTCASIALAGGTSKDYCLRTCSPKLGSSDCSGGLACHPHSGALVGLFDEAVCLLYGCASGADCPVLTFTTCDTNTTPCASGQTCIPVLGGQTAGHCAKAGVCDAASGLCQAHTLGLATASVGDPCRDDTECGGAMQCMMEVDLAKYRKQYLASCTDDDECCSGSCQAGACTQGLCTVNNRNGYCTVAGCTFAGTLPLRACPAGSACSTLYSGGRCLRTCSLTSAATCRGEPADLLGDYECRAWNNLTLGGTAITSAPVCEPGPGMTCDIFGSSSTLDCSAVGNSSNTTQMTCRGLDNKVKTNLKDPTGFCLDNTSSGSGIRSPLP